MLISYTLPCHKREADLAQCLPSVLAAARLSPPVEIVIVDYGCVPPLCDTMDLDDDEVSIRVVRVEAEYFHMAHARNVGLREAFGEIVVAFLADQFVTPSFFTEIRTWLQPGVFLKWEETFAFFTQDIMAAGGFDERFELYGPEGKELPDRLERRGLARARFGRDSVSQLRTTQDEKVRHYRVGLSKTQMHHIGMAYWRDNQARAVTVANEGLDWGAVTVPCLT